MKKYLQKTLALVMAFLMFMTVMPAKALAGPGTSGTGERSLGPDLTKGNLSDLLTFFNSPGYVTKDVKYVGLEYYKTEGRIINLKHTRWFIRTDRLGNREMNQDHDDYLCGTYIIRFQDPNFYKHIDSMQIGGSDFKAYNFGNDSELNKSTWVIKCKDLPRIGQIGSVVNDEVQINLTNGKSLENLNLRDKKLYYDQLVINNNREIEFNSVSNGFILANEDNSAQYKSNFLSGVGTNRAILDLTPGKEALKIVYTFKPDENFLQTNFSWVAYPKAILPKELMPLLDTDIVTIYNSESNGDRTPREEFAVSVSDKDKAEGVITTRGTRNLSIHKDAGFEYIDESTGQKVSEGRIPLTLKDLETNRARIDRIFYGVLGRSRSFTFRIPLNKTTTNKEFIEKMKEIAKENGGKIPLKTEIEADWPDFKIRAPLAPGYPDEGKEPPVIEKSVSQSYINFIDSDNDGLPDMTELNLGTDPAKPDSDNDGISDGQEVIYDGTDPLEPRNYKPGAPRADEDSKIIEVDKEVTINGALEDYLSKIEAVKGQNAATSLAPTDTKAAPVKVFIAKYIDNNGADDYDRSRVYGSTEIPLDKLAGDRKFTLTIPANQLPQNFDYILVAESPDGKVKVVGDKIQTKGIMLHANNGTDKVINIPVATDGGKTQLPDCSQEFKNGNKQLVGFAYKNDAQIPDSVDGLFIGNATQVDASKLEHKDLYAVYKDKITVTVTKTWKDAKGKELTPAPNHKVKIGLMFRTAVGAPHMEIIHDPLAAYFPVAGTIQELKNNKATWTLPGYDKFGNRLSYIAAEIKEGDEDKFYNFDPGKGTWADLDIKLYETEFNIPGDFTSGIKVVGHKEQFAQFKTGDQIDTYSSATQRKINVAPEGQGNFFTSYEISMTNTKIDVAPPRIVQGYENEEIVKIVAPNDDDVTKMTVQIGDKGIITLEKDPADGIFKSKDSGVEVTAPTEGSKEYKIKTEPLVKGTIVTATSFGNNAQAVDTMTVRERVPSGIPTDVKQVKHEKDGDKTNAVVTAVPGTISGDKVPAGTTYELVKDDGNGNFVSVDESKPLMGTVGEDGKIRFVIPEGTLAHGTELKIRQKSPEQKPSDSEAITLDLKAPVITAEDILGYVGTEITGYTVTTDEPARLSTVSQEKLPEGLSAITGTNDPKYQLPQEWTLHGAPEEEVDKTITIQAEDAFGNVATKDVHVTIKPRIITNPKGEKEDGYARVTFVTDENKARLVGTTVYDVYIDNENPVKVRELEKPNVITDENKYNSEGWKLKGQDTEITGSEDITGDMTIEAVFSTNAPVVGETTVSQNARIEAKDFVKNKGRLPNGTEYQFKGAAPSTAVVGEQQVTIIVTKPGETPQEFTTKLIVTANIIPATGNNKPQGFYTVEFVPGGHGKIAPGEESKYYVKPDVGVKMGDITPPNIIAETGYEFVSWSKKYKADEVIIGDKQVTAVYNYKNAVSTEKVEGWSKVTLLSGDYGKFSKTYIKEGQTVTDYNENLTYWVDPSRVATIPTPNVEAETGYTFTGFDNPLTDRFDDNTIITAMYISSKDVIVDDTPDNDGDDNLQKPKGYVTVKFAKGDHGEFADNQNIKYFVNPKKNVAIGAPAIEAKEGYIFDKYTDEKGMAHSADAKMYTEDVTYTAQYTEAGDISDKPVKGYLEIKFVAGDKASFEGRTEKEISFYVKPNSGKKLSELLTGKFAEPNLVYKDGYKQGDTKWTPKLEADKELREAKTYTANAVAKAIITTDESKQVPEGFVRLTFTTDEKMGTFTAKLDGSDTETTGIKKLFVDVKPLETMLEDATKVFKVVPVKGISHMGWSKDGKTKLENYYTIRNPEEFQAFYNNNPEAPTVDPVRAGDTVVKVTNPVKIAGQEHVNKISIAVNSGTPIVAEKQLDGTWKVDGQVVTEVDGKLQIPVPALKNKDTLDVVATDDAGNHSDPTTVTVGLDTTELEKSIDKADKLAGENGQNLKPETNSVDKALQEALKKGKETKDDAKGENPTVNQQDIDKAKTDLDKAIAQKEADKAVDNAKDKVLDPKATDDVKNNAINDAQDKIDAIPGTTNPDEGDNYNPIKKELQDKLDLIKKIKEGEDRLKQDDIKDKPTKDINSLKDAIEKGKEAIKQDKGNKEITDATSVIEKAIDQINKERIKVGIESYGVGTKTLRIKTSVSGATVIVKIGGKKIGKITTDSFGEYSMGLKEALKSDQDIILEASKAGYNDGLFDETVY